MDEKKFGELMFPYVAHDCPAQLYQLNSSVELSSLILEEHGKRIRDCLSTFLPRLHSLVKPIHRGHSDARNYIVAAGDSKYLLKLIPLDLAEPVSLKELYMIQEASHLGIAPKVIASSDSQRAVLMEYIEGPTLMPEVAKKHARQIGTDLRTLHESVKNPHVEKSRYLDERLLLFALNLRGSY